MDAQRGRKIERLKARDIRWGSNVGAERYIQAIERGARESRFSMYDNWTHNIEGALSELAMHRVFGIPWPGSTHYDPHAPDVILPDGTELEVRLAKPERQVLRIRHRDKTPEKLARTWLLLNGRIGVYEVIGYMRGRDALQDRWLKTDRSDPSIDAEWHEVPASELTPLYADDFPHWRPPSAA